MPESKESPIESIQAPPVEVRAKAVAKEHAHIESELKQRLAKERRILFIRKFWWLLPIALVVLITGGVFVVQTWLVTEAPAGNAAPTPPDPFPLIVTNVTPLVREAERASVVSYDVLVTVENRSPVWAVESFAYDLSLFDASGALVGSRRALSFIPAESQRRFGVFNVPVTGQAVRAAVVVSEIQPIAQERIPAVPLAVTNVQPSEDVVGGTAVQVVTATVQNNSLFTAQNADVIAVIYNAQGGIVGINGTQLVSLASGASQSVRLLWPDYPAGASRIEIEALTNPAAVAVQ